MIEVLEQSTEGCLAVRLSGKVTGEEYQQLLGALAPRMKTGEQVSLVLELEDFSFYGDLESAKKDLGFGFGDYRRIRRAAFVGDQKWLEWFTRILGPFTRAEEKHFAAGQLEAALNWASVW